MKLTHLHIRNFRSCRNIILELGGMHALVGANNSGKSSVLRALDFLFNPSSRSLNEESFWNKDTSLEIRVEAVFSDLTEAERAALGPYLRPDETFKMARTARMGEQDGESEADSEPDDAKITIGQQCQIPIPEPEWLQRSSINGKKITDWWQHRTQLDVGGISFGDFLDATKKPSVNEWKTKAEEFVSLHAGRIPMIDKWKDNPRGYANVLKGTLPFFVLVPAVRDVTEEAKGTKSSPFGRLLSAILDTVTQEQKGKVEAVLNDVACQMNRSGGEERIPLIAHMEESLNSLLEDFFAGCDLEIEFDIPTLQVLLSSPRLYVDDGFRNSVENKGHGLQRAVIFTILRQYAEHMTMTTQGRKRGLILAVEEPELYMHPQAQRTVRRVFEKMVRGGDQVFFSTHSPLFVDVADFDQIVRMESLQAITDGQKTRESRAWQLPMASMIRDMEARYPDLQGKITRESIRERYSHVYNPRRNEGFFASRIILVEGATEEYSLPIYADALPNCGFDAKGISVVECGGKESIDRLYRIFNELHIPCYILFDYDRENADSETIRASKELLRLVGAEENAPQSLLVRDCVACFPQTWETHLRDEIPNADSLEAEARQKLGDVGKPLIARYVARKLTEREPPQVPQSLRAIIERAIEVTWTKSCLAGTTDGTLEGGYQ